VNRHRFLLRAPHLFEGKLDTELERIFAQQDRVQINI
jgi:hypothetical protein